MPLNTLRLNHAPSSHPNDRIVFIKPLPRPASDQASYKIAETLLNAIAAQCLPIMKAHHLSVTTLEEHEPNPEFIGRNFNNGEIIQLVLKSKSGAWLPVNMVQMVMMHELAHNLQMNHSKQFWEVRNGFVEELRGLWGRGFTGEGFWGGGRVLGEIRGLVGGMGGVVPSEELKDLQVCGGTFRSRGRARKRKQKGSAQDLTWKEKKQRRIEKKFGKNGVALGEDEDRRLALEVTGKGPLGVKPRVAQSKRGRELRAAAALARFDTNKKEVEELDVLKSEDGEDTGTGSDDDDEYEDIDAGQEDARDTDGERLLDSKGHGMIKVCEEEDGCDLHVKQEMAELEALDHKHFAGASDSASRNVVSDDHLMSMKPTAKPRSLYDIPQYQEEPTKKTSSSKKPQPNKTVPSKSNITIQPSKSSTLIAKPSTSSTTSQPRHPPKNTSTPPSLPPTEPPTTTHPSNRTKSPSSLTTNTNTTCPICSLSNPAPSVTCIACAHVLDRRKDPRSWKCHSDSCRDTAYINAGDVGVCGICGARRAS